MSMVNRCKIIFRIWSNNVSISLLVRGLCKIIGVKSQTFSYYIYGNHLTSNFKKINA